MSFLRVNSLSKSYGVVQALRNVSFEVQKGHTHALVGENGAGKSTLIKILSGAEKADSGQIWLDETTYTPRNPKDALRANVSTIYQIFNLMPDRSIMHNVLLGKEPRNAFGLLDLQRMREQTQAVLGRLNAAHLSPEMPVEELTVGEKQIIEIARALMNESQLMIMDEPTAALNQTEVDALFEVIKRLKTQGVTILYVSHRLEEIFHLADAVTILRDGTHISTGLIENVTRDSLVEDMIGRQLSSVFPELPEVPPDAEKVLYVEDLSVHKFLYDINFSLRRGEVLAVAGLSGSGKTELGKALYGDLPLKSGTIILNGMPYKPAPWTAIRRRFIYLPEDRKADGVLQELPIRRNISLSILGRLSNAFGFLDLKREREVAQYQIDALEIKTPHMDQEVMNLSGGNQQKVALAKCLAVNPDIFIMMEPTQGIDVGVKFEIYQFIAEQVKQGHSVLLISSELIEILGLSHRILVMNEGHIAAQFNTKETTQEEILRYALGEESRASSITPQMN
ncbi:MAG TPA: sugar ABC transporter ATP-binding protein [Aggregatilineales bacterium]|nr:sugar ABC transporter ATP-binding protein [Aggregatilineales bacterium]